MEFVTRYMNSTIPAQPNWLRQVLSFSMHSPVQILASIRWLTPIVKHSSIMLL